MGINLTEASKEVGITKAGLVKAIKKGRLSAEKNEKGEWMVDPAELFRVYPKVKPVVSIQNEKVGVGIDTENKGLRREIELQREQIKLLIDQIDGLKDDKEKAYKMLAEQIATVRQLTDQREGQAAKKTGFWARMFG